jgi:hypothetical protein
MNAHEYRMSLTDRQAKAFTELLENALRASGWYSKNSEAHQAGMKLYYDGRDRHKAELEEAERKYHEQQDKIRELQEQIRKISNEATEQLEAARNAIGLIIQEENREENERINTERGDHRAEREIIEQIIIAQYQARLEKKTRKEVA